ncbi:unnamed protein product [Dracunculus medinensis]|uniref:MATH domain-containing protein n=1 Tax=Dracunculus medinensis TaxID=318479 RepID=A0A0N4UHJ2_DRAME|nr:unnamed protein product [Dracunculus medinensis]
MPFIIVTTVSTSVDTSSPSSSSDGILRLTIKNFKSMTDTVRGESKEIQSIPWRIMVMPRQHVVQKKGTQKCLGFFLQCCPNAYSDSWSCQAAAELRLISQKASVPHFTRKTNHVYTAKENDWGYSCFMTWADIQDEEQGYIKDDTVILEVSVKAEPAKNVLTQEQFRKKIQDYKRLADIQSSRGYLDKAIECNASALKFCRDRDKACREELEIQKQQLIDLKLKQSIERIEKGRLIYNLLFQITAAFQCYFFISILLYILEIKNYRLQTPPPPAKPTVEKRNFIEKIGTETHLDDLKIEKEIPMPGITAATCKDVCKNPKGQRKSGSLNFQKQLNQDNFDFSKIIFIVVVTLLDMD